MKGFAAKFPTFAETTYDELTAEQASVSSKSRLWMRNLGARQVLINMLIDIASALAIPIGAFTIWYFTTHHLISVRAHVVGLLIGLGVQAALMIYGFAILKPSIPDSLRAGAR